MFVVPSCTDWKTTQRDLIVTKWKVRIKFLIWAVSYTVIRYAKSNCNKNLRFWVPRYFTETYSHLAGHRCSAGNIFREALVWSIGGMILTGENWSNRETPVPLSRCPPQIPRDVVWDPTRAFSVRGWGMIAWDMTADWGRCTGLSVRSKCEVFRWISDRTGWRAVHATGLSVDGRDFLYMQQDCQLTVVTSCTCNRTVSWRSWLPVHATGLSVDGYDFLYMQQDCQLTVVTSCTCNRTVSWRLTSCTCNRTVSWRLTSCTCNRTVSWRSWLPVHATGLSVDGYDFLYMQQDCQLTVDFLYMQ